MNALSILLLGDIDRAEFHDARVCLDGWAMVHQFAETAAAADALARAEIAPDLIVVAQAFPGQFSHEAVDRLRQLAPLARILGLMGSWCEGELRSGSPWPATMRAYWHQWPVRCQREFRRLAEGRWGSWALPPTATEEERLLADVNCRILTGPHAGSPLKKGTGFEQGSESPAENHGREVPVPLFQPSHPGRGLVVIRSPSLEMADWLSAACRRLGLATLRQRTPSADRVTGAAAAIFDASDLSEDECSDLKQLAAALKPAPVIALLAFPRAEDYRRALSAGAAAVLSKPLAVEDLFWQIDAVAAAGQQPVYGNTSRTHDQEEQ